MSTITTEAFTEVTERQRLEDAISTKTKEYSSAMSEIEGLKFEKLSQNIETIQKTVSMLGQSLASMMSHSKTKGALQMMAPFAQILMGAGTLYLSRKFKEKAHETKMFSAEQTAMKAFNFLEEKDPNFNSEPAAKM